MLLNIFCLLFVPPPSPLEKSCETQQQQKRVQNRTLRGELVRADREMFLSTSPSHRLREMSTQERHHVQSSVDSADQCVEQLYQLYKKTPPVNSTNDETAAAVAASSVENIEQHFPLQRWLNCLLDVILADESVCGGLVKTTRTVPILRRLLERRLEIEKDFEDAQDQGQGQQGEGGHRCVQLAVRSIFRASLPTVAKLLRVLIVSSHSRRAFHGFMQQGRSSCAFLDLLRYHDTLMDASRALSHVLLYSQDAKDVLDHLITPAAGGLLNVLRDICHDAAVVWTSHPLILTTQCTTLFMPGVPLEMGLLSSTLMLMAATAGVTPRPEAIVVHTIVNLFTQTLVPHIVERAPLWLSLTTTDAPPTSRASSHGAREQQPHLPLVCLQLLIEEAMQLGCVLATTVADYHEPVDGLTTSSSIDLQAAMSSVLEILPNTTDPQLVELWGACSAQLALECGGTGGGGGDDPASSPWVSHVVRRCREHLGSIRRHNLDSKAVQRALLAMLRDIQPTRAEEGSPARPPTTNQSSHAWPVPPPPFPCPSQPAGPAQLYSFVLGRLPGGIKTLFGTLSTVDEEVSSLSCAVLIAILRASSATPRTLPTCCYDEGGGPYSELLHCRLPVHQFAALDGVLLLCDMLDDYSDDVLAGAVGLLSAAASSPKVIREMEHHGVFRKLRLVVRKIAEKRLPRALAAEAPMATANHSPPFEERGADGEAENMRTLIPLSTLCCDCMARLPPDAVRAVFPEHNPEDSLKPTLFSWWSQLNGMLTACLLEEEEGGGGGGDGRRLPGAVVFPLLGPFARWLCNIARVLGGGMVFSSIPLNESVPSPPTADCTPATPTPWMGRWVRFALRAGGVDAAVALVTSLLRVLHEGSISGLFSSSTNDDDAMREGGACGGGHSPEDLAASIHDTACVMFAIPFDTEAKQQLVFGVFWEFIAEVVRAAPAPVVDSLRMSLYESLLGCLRVSSMTGAPKSSVTIQSMMLVLHAWGLARQDEVVNLLATYASRDGIPLQDRALVVNLLLNVTQTPNEGVDDDTEPSTTCMMLQPTVSREVKETCGLLWTRIILLCEDGSTSSDDSNNTDSFTSFESVANVCFAALVQDAEAYVCVLIRAAMVVLDSMLYMQPEALLRSPVSLPWLGNICDTDEAHDVLVALVPLINGLLSQSPSCRWGVVVDSSAGAPTDAQQQNPHSLLTFFVRLVSCGGCLEVPLKVLGIYGLWHCLDLSSPPSPSLRAQLGGCHQAAAEEARVAVLLRSWNTLLVLVHIQREASDMEQPEDAQEEIRNACYLLAERMVLLSASASSGSPATAAAAGGGAALPLLSWEDVWQFVELTVFSRGALEPQACSLLLCVLQDDRSREYFRASSCHHLSAVGGGGAPRADAPSSAPYFEILRELRGALRQELFPQEVADRGGCGDDRGLLGTPTAAAAIGQHNSQAYYALLQVEKYLAEM